MRQPTIANAVAPDSIASEFDLPAVDLPGMADCLAHQPDVAAAYVFGSVARGQASHLSDVDIAVLLDPSLERTTALERQLALVQAPETYARSKIQLVVLDQPAPALSPKLTAMVRLRNLIVHDYVRIGYQVVFARLKKRLDDFDQHARAILVYVESQASQ